jgi:hypothetical protein
MMAMFQAENIPTQFVAARSLRFVLVSARQR